MENADQIVPRDAISEVLGMTDELVFFENLNNDFHLYKDSLSEGQELTSADFIAYLRDELKWSKVDLDYVESLAEELDTINGVGLINDMQYAQELSRLLDAFMDALNNGDVAAEIRAEGAARSLYHEQQLKVYRAEGNWTPQEEMQLQEIIEEEASKIIEIYRLAANGEDINELSDEKVLELIDFIF